MTALIKRRNFIKTTGAASLGLSLAGSALAVPSRTAASDKITVAIMGTNARGSALAKGFATHPKAEIAYICDVDDLAMKKGVEAATAGGQKKAPKGIKDFRQALDDDAVDALVIAAPDHWHAPAAIMALQAGKHVYVEKPCSHNPHEGELLVSAAQKYGKVVQVGNQRRSWPKVIEGMQLLKEGAIGRAYFARGWYANQRESMGYGKVAPVPAHLDYELWQGPAPRRPYKDNLIHYNWHWIWHWGTGEMLNNGTHFIDLCRWGLEVDYPTRVTSSGGRYHWKDDWETPDTQLVTYDFEDEKSILWEGRSCNPRGIEGSATGASFHGENGTMVVDGNGYVIYDNDNKEIKSSKSGTTNAIDATGPGFDLDQDHFTNFIEGIQQGKKLNSDITNANISVHLCHLGNIAHRTGRVIHCDTKNGHIIDDKEALQFWGREYEEGWAPSV